MAKTRASGNSQAFETPARKATFLEILNKNMGNVYKSCKDLNLLRCVYYDWYNKDKDFHQKVEDINEGLIDRVVGELYEKIFTEHNITAILYFLKTKGKSRGFGSDVNIEYKLDLQKLKKAIEHDAKLHQRDY